MSMSCCAVCAAGYRASVVGRLCCYHVCLPEGAVTAVLGVYPYWSATAAVATESTDSSFN